eukprot:scaffold91660_cov31-Tisochrysis_lutea.AAC.3
MSERRTNSSSKSSNTLPQVTAHPPRRPFLSTANGVGGRRHGGALRERALVRVGRALCEHRDTRDHQIDESVGALHRACAQEGGGQLAQPRWHVLSGIRVARQRAHCLHHVAHVVQSSAHGAGVLECVGYLGVALPSLVQVVGRARRIVAKERQRHAFLKLTSSRRTSKAATRPPCVRSATIAASARTDPTSERAGAQPPCWAVCAPPAASSESALRGPGSLAAEVPSGSPTVPPPPAAPSSAGIATRRSIATSSNAPQGKLSTLARLISSGLESTRHARARASRRARRARARRRATTATAAAAATAATAASHAPAPLRPPPTPMRRHRRRRRVACSLAPHSLFRYESWI